MGKAPRVLVTGGGTGIGFACAQALAQAGCSIAIAGRRGTILAEAAAVLASGRVGAVPPTVIALTTDLAGPDEPERLVRRCVEQLGGVDVLVNNAATCAPTPTLDLHAEHWNAVVDGGLRGAVLAAVAAARFMAAHDGGRIVNITSIDAQIAEPNVGHYSAAKAGLEAFGRSLAVDAASGGVRVNSVAPGWVRTDAASVRLDGAGAESMARLNPLGRAAEPEELAEVVRWLALDAPDFLTGSTIVVDGGQTIMAAMP